jgi:hypothetical protein
MELICTQSPQMFHNHATPRRIYITADKLCLNKLSKSTTHSSRVKPLPPPPPSNVEHRVTSTSMRLNFYKCYWLPSFPPSPGQLERQDEVPHASGAKRRLMQVTEQLGSAFGRPIRFFGCRERPSSGDWLTDCRLCVAKEEHTRVGREVASFCCVKRGPNDLGHYPIWTDRAIWTLRFGKGTNGNSEKFFKILKQKIY